MPATIEIGSNRLVTLQDIGVDSPRPTYWTEGRHDNNRLLMHEIAQKTADAAKNSGASEIIDVDDALERTSDRIERSFGEYEAPAGTLGYGEDMYGFLAHTRVSREPLNDYRFEGQSAYPLLGLMANETAQMFLAPQCPAVLEVFGPSRDNPTGLGFFTPLHQDMIADGLNGLDPVLLEPRYITEVINNTADFARRAGCTVQGLGGILSSLTRFGELIKDEGTCTGHAGTVVGMREIMRDILFGGYDFDGVEMDLERPIGIVGAAGAIGLSTFRACLADPDLGQFQFIGLEDPAKPERQEKLEVIASQYGGQLQTAKNFDELARRCGPLIAIASTSPIECSPSSFKGHVPLDDSEPGSIPDDTENSVKVLLDDGELTKRNEILDPRFCGASPTNAFTCAATIAGVSTLDPSERGPHLFARPVEQKDVEAIDELFSGLGIKTPALQRPDGTYFAKKIASKKY
jgi:hypothetical protein